MSAEIISEEVIKILLIEDNPGDVLLIRKMLDAAQGAEFNLEHTDRLSNGLVRLTEKDFDVVLLDLSLPDSWGLQTFTRVQTQIPHIPIVVLTGYNDEALAIEALAKGAQDYLIKGQVDSNLLGRSIRYAIERQRAEEEMRRRNRELSLLYHVIATATSSLDITEVLHVLCRELALAFDLPQVTALFINSEDKTVSIITEYLAQQCSSAVGLTFPVSDNTAIHHILTHKTPLFITNAQNDERLAELHPIMHERGTTSMLMVPVIARDRTISTLGLSTVKPRTFTDDEVALAQSAAAAAGQALETADLYQELRRHVNHLEDMVAQRTAELQTAVEQAQAADRAKSQFLSNVSHELRTPLTNIKLYLDLLKRGQKDKRNTYMATMRRETERLQRLIEDLLDLSRLDLGKVQANLKPIDLNKLVHMLAQDRKTLFADRGLCLTVQTAQTLPTIQADAKLLEQVITNLLTNALNYTPSGGEVWVQTKTRQSNERAWVTVSVQDTGPGISSEEQARLFKRFYRGAASLKTSVPGTGLGLAISKEIVELHKGQITLESEVGGGSIFTIWLPVTPQATA